MVQKFNLIIIGDELLNGRRSDCHLPNMIELMAERGLELYRSLMIGDTPELIIETLRSLHEANNIVFCFGGIGATPDDYTRQCAAQAFSVPLLVHEQGKKILEDKFGDQAYPHRIHMVTIPSGSRLIPNPYNNIPGFSYEHFHFVPGFPQMAKPMIAWVLDTYYQDLSPAMPLVRRSLLVYGKNEGELVDLMNALLTKYADIKLSCLPRIDVQKTYVELSVLGDPSQIDSVYQYMVAELDAMSAEWQQAP